MSSRYAPLPTGSREDEMNAAFDDSDDEQDHQPRRAPILPQHNSSSSSSSHPLADSPSTPTQSTTYSGFGAPPPHVPGTYDFEYDYPPPPGSPPPIPTFASSNGYIPLEPSRPSSHRPNVFRRALGAVWPSRYARDERGGGTGNDGVFSNMAAKPGVPTASHSGGASGLHFTPEEVQKEAPPSYQAAQADAVPPYWETTIIAPSQSTADGELIVDHLPTGSLFSFLWNLLVSMSFQFVGFLLTYLLHTTHAAKFGSRAGLGVTLIQYGFYLRNRAEFADGEMAENAWGWTAMNDNPPAPKPTFATPEEAAKYYAGLEANKTATPTIDPELVASIQASATTANEWLSFVLMTVGWFVLLTSLLGFWRVKRWERGVRRAAQEAANPRPPPTSEELAQEAAVIANIEETFGIVSSRVQSGADHFRAGLGLPMGWSESPGGAAAQDRARFDELTRR